MPIFLGVLLAGAAVVAGGAAGNAPLQAEVEKWRNKDHKELKGPAPGSPTAPLRVPVAGGRPLWMADDVAPETVDPRLADALVFRPELDGKERKATHWTLNDKGDADADASRGDGGA
jgi:hypothetical protein